ncbi:MAG: aldolase/citrate lyase family protein [Parvularcula sp.]|jgi:2-keto-3-deoxy-L-rhamnonate aldolase RhmA|nr:aldolase/citrate lyase family protein [Parvularcula sp.]
MTDDANLSFARRLCARERLLATWIKTPHPHVVEVLGLTELDALVIDAEHAPFDRSAIDAALLAARAASIAALVRPPANEAAAILQALDGGAGGIVVPHIRNAEEAASAVKACRYVPGGRGFAGSTRAAAYTTKGMAAQRATSGDPLVIAQIEDAEALEHLSAIASTPGLDALFVGRADLTVSLEAGSPDDAVVVKAVADICAAAKRANIPVGMFLARPTDAREWEKKGATFFFLKSDQEFLLAGARDLIASFNG